MRFVANSVNNVYLKPLLDEVRSLNSCEGVTAAVAYLSWADDLMDFCVQARVPLRLFSLFNAEALPNQTVIERCLDHAMEGWELWFTDNYYHPKIIWFRNAGVYVGSANLTMKSWKQNVEAGFYFNNEDIARHSLDAQLTAFFRAIGKRFRKATREDLAAVKSLSHARKSLSEAESLFDAEFRRLVPPLPGSESPAAVGVAGQNLLRDEFVREWADTLELLRSFQQQLAILHQEYGRRWVPENTPLGVEVGQAINFFYENHIRGTDSAAAERVEKLHAQNRNRPQNAADQMLREWMTSEVPQWIREIIIEWAPEAQVQLSKTRLEDFGLPDWQRVCSRCFAIRNVARQISNSTLGKAEVSGQTSLDERVLWFAEYSWSKRTGGGHTLREMLNYLIWDDGSSVMERVWRVAYADGHDWKLPYIGVSTAGELIGLARPDEFPPRNNRDSRVLYALGFNVERYGGA